jgi:thiol-disulfide isomerase/thioredoxin
MKKENFQEQKLLSLNNLSVPIAIVIAGLIIAGAIIVTNQNPKTSLKETGQQSAQILPDTNSKAQPSPEQPSQKPAVVEFEITKDDHIRGDFDAPITLVEFSDFECPFCERHFPTLNKILSDYKGKVRLVYKHFPLEFHPMLKKQPRLRNALQSKENSGNTTISCLKINQRAILWRNLNSGQKI